eukprot:gene7116-221_t
MPILHKYNFSRLLKCTEWLVGQELNWKQFSYGWDMGYNDDYTLGQWLLLAEELQLVGLHGAVHRVLKRLKFDKPNDIHFLIEAGRQINQITSDNKKQVTALGVLVEELDRLGVKQIVNKAVKDRCSTRNGEHCYENPNPVHGAPSPEECTKASHGALCMHCRFCPHCGEKVLAHVTRRTRRMSTHVNVRDSEQPFTLSVLFGDHDSRGRPNSVQPTE